VNGTHKANDLVAKITANAVAARLTISREAHCYCYVGVIKAINWPIYSITKMSS
jgi:hypothetical protein